MIGRIIKTGLTGTLAGLVLFGCATTEKARKNVEQPIKTPEKIAIEHEESMKNLKKTKEGESNKSNEYFSKDLKKYNKGTDKRYEEALRKVEEEREKYKRGK